MPADNIMQRRDRALIALALITGARVGALASFQLRDVNVEHGYVDQDARHVQTKFAKTFRTYFMPVSDLALEIVQSWHGEMSADVTRGPTDPLFPATLLSLDKNGAFAPAGLSREGWSGTGPVREIFKRAFTLADLPYFNPHSLRETLAHYAMALQLSPEAMKAWSQNLGHNEVMTTFNSYGNVPTHRQGELIKACVMHPNNGADGDPIAEMEALLAKMKAAA